MSSSSNNPFSKDPFNPYAAPETMDYSSAAPSEMELATLSERFTGAFLDGLLVVPVVFGVVFAYGYASAQQGNAAVVSIGDQLLLSVISVVVFFAWFLILNGYLLANRGQTIGKLAAGTRIVDVNTGELLPLVPLVLKRNLLIQLLGAIPIAGGFINLIGILMIFRSSRRCLHDELAGTKVIKVKKS